MGSLSPNEEVTLRRVALGLTAPDKLPSAHLKRLSHLKLIESAGGALRLTPLGRQHYDALPRPAGAIEEGTLESIISTALRRRTD